jgi:ribosomal protein S18 acetylase RimI-like enzyme
MIKKATEQDDFKTLAKLLNDSFATVAKEFGLTKSNSPTNNAFINHEELKSQLTENREFYYYFDNFIVGFIAIEKSSKDSDVFYIEKVAVLPHFRHKGIGFQLMEFATKRILELGGKRISIGLINSNTKLKEWYKNQSFNEVEIKSYEHLPFEVCIMEKLL